MATPVEIKNAIIQYAFISRPNPISQKFGFSALIPYDPNCPQCQAVITASNNEWQKVAAGSNNPQSVGYTIIAATDAKHIHPDVLPMLDPARHYMHIRGVQDGDTTTPIEIYDSVPNVVPNKNIIGNGSVCNFRVTAYGYATAGQKGVKFYAQWLQIVSLIENTNANTGPSSIEAGGYVAEGAALVAPQMPQQQVVAQGAPAVNVMPTAPTAMPGVYAAPAAPVYAAPAAPVYAAPAAPAAPVYAAPAPTAPTAAPVYAAPTAPAAPAAPVYAAPAPGAPVAPVAPVMPAAY